MFYGGRRLAGIAVAPNLKACEEENTSPVSIQVIVFMSSFST